MKWSIKLRKKEPMGSLSWEDKIDGLKTDIWNLFDSGYIKIKISIITEKPKKKVNDK